jgi:hypothetical protein
VGAAGALGDVAADLAGAAAGGIGRVVQAGLRHGALQTSQIRRAPPRPPVRRIDPEDRSIAPPTAGSAPHRKRPSRQAPSPSAASPDRSRAESARMPETSSWRRAARSPRAGRSVSVRPAVSLGASASTGRGLPRSALSSLDRRRDPSVGHGPILHEPRGANGAGPRPAAHPAPDAQPAAPRLPPPSRRAAAIASSFASAGATSVGSPPRR